MAVSSHRSLLSPRAKEAIARELGVAGIVAAEGWGAVPSRECGMVVRVALEHAERALAAARGGRREAAPGAARWS
jgi:small acid-soluble spore protein F (minor alpha/beta-type SASP)